MKDRVVFVSGGSSGFGAYFVASALADGGSVFCASKSSKWPDNMDGVTEPRCVTGVLDVTDYKNCESSIKECLAKFGRIDILLNNASGYFGGKLIGMYSSDEIKREIEVTLLGTINLTNAFAAHAIRQPERQYVVCISSISGVGLTPGDGLNCVYATAKAGVIRFTETINETLRDTNTSAHVVIPNNIRAEKYVEQNAVSQSDVYAAIRFLTESRDNMYIGQLILNPFQTSPVDIGR